MSKNKIIVVSAILGGIGLLTYFLTRNGRNPASVYCERLGYKSEGRTNPDGSQYGVCIFPDGSECEEWAFYRGECGTEWIPK